MARTKTPLPVETEVLTRSRRWCALCFGLNLELGPRTQGQIAHVDRNAVNSAVDNLCWLCLPHHDLYDSRPSQSKGLTPAELRRHREDLYAFLTEQRARLSSPELGPLSTEAWAVAELLSSRSHSGRHLDSQVRLDALPALTGLSENAVEVAVDELRSTGLVDLNGTRQAVFATNRFFWETDPIFQEFDPAADAAVIARVLAASNSGQVGLSELADQLGWEPRRLNPSSTYLCEAGYATATPGIASKYWTNTLFGGPSTKRFVRDLDASLAPRSA